MAQALRPDAPYKQSRATLREIFGSRSIDASAPQSDRDQTPSGRLRYQEGGPDQTPSGRLAERMRSGMTSQEAKDAEMQNWRRTFGPLNDGAQNAPIAQVFRSPRNFEGMKEQDIADFKRLSGEDGMPAGWRAARAPMQQLAEPDDILSAFTQGAASGQFKTPFGPVSFKTPQASPLSIPLNASAPIPASDLSQFVPAGLGAGPTVPWKQQSKPAYMSGIFAGASRWT